MIIQCPHCGKPVTVNGLGRKRLNIPLKIVCECVRRHFNGIPTDAVSKAASELNCSQGYIFKVLKDNGLKLRDVIVNDKGRNLPESINQRADDRQSATRVEKVGN